MAGLVRSPIRWVSRFPSRIPTQGKGVGVPIIPGYALTKLSYASWVSSLAATGCTVEDLGTDTGAANTVYGLSYGSGDKPWLFLLGGIHGQHEWPNGYILRDFMAILSGAAEAPTGTDGYFQRIRDTFRVYSIPIANPYGWINNVYENVNDVNLNRNFDAFWSVYDESSGIGLKGSAAFSEIEAQIVRDKAQALLPVGFVDFHIRGGGDGSQIEVLEGADEAFWTTLNTRFVASVRPSASYYVQMDGLPQSQQWVRTVTASNGKKPLSATFEPGDVDARAEQVRLVLNFAFQFCLAAADHVASGWPEASSQVATIQPNSVAGVDTQISAAVANGNYGANVVISAGDTSGIRRGLIRFPLDSIPPGAVVQSATLSLFCSSQSSATARSIAMHRALLEWFEGPHDAGTTPGAGVDASTWNNRNHNGSVAWGAAGGQGGTDYATTASDATSVTGAGAWFDWDVTGDVQEFVNGVHESFGWFVINADEATANSRKMFTSSEELTLTTQRPKLTVTYR